VTLDSSRPRCRGWILSGAARGLPGFRNVLVHEYVALDYGRVLEALGQLDDIETFARTVAKLEASERH
jgi:uncharacterized protein YutE (UPF0331/DUF86 family)